jgi:hypothetical protein
LLFFVRRPTWDGIRKPAQTADAQAIHRVLSRRISDETIAPAVDIAAAIRSGTVAPGFEVHTGKCRLAWLSVAP